MSLITISKQTQNNITNSVGVTYTELVNYNPSSELSLINKKVSFSKKRDFRKIGRGNPLLARKRIRTINDVEKKLAKIK